MNSHILFLNVPAYGHVYSTLPMVEELVRRGHRISYAVPEKFTDPVSATGAHAVPYPSRLSTVLEAGNIDITDADRMAWGLVTFADEAAANVPRFESLFVSDPPDLVAYDMMIGLQGRVLARKLGRPSLQLCTSFASNEHFSLSRYMLESARIDPGHPALAAMQAKTMEFLAGQGVGAEAIPEMVAEQDQLNLVFLTKSFQIDGETFDERYRFVGPCVGGSAFSGQWQPPADRRPVVLMALSTMFGLEPDFLRSCIRAFGDSPWHTVITLSDGQDPAGLGPLPENVEVHRWISLPAVLEHARVFVGPAAMGSTMLALHSGTPVVGLPQMFEQEAIGQRIVDLGLGQVIPRAEATVPRLIESVAAVAGNSDIRAGVLRMRDDIHAAGGTVGAADEIEKYLARSAAHMSHPGSIHG
jgi:MGT family glycosyltransferase